MSPFPLTPSSSLIQIPAHGAENLRLRLRPRINLVEGDEPAALIFSETSLRDAAAMLSGPVYGYRCRSASDPHKQPLKHSISQVIAVSWSHSKMRSL